MKCITGEGIFYLIFSWYDYRMVGIFIYCHLFFNWSLVLWNELKSPSAWKRTSVTWMEQLSSDTKLYTHYIYVLIVHIQMIWSQMVSQAYRLLRLVFTRISNPSSDHLLLSRERSLILWKHTVWLMLNMQSIYYTKNELNCNILSGTAFLGNQTYNLRTVNIMSYRNAKVKA